MNDAFLHIKKTPSTLTRQPDRSHMPATAPRAKSGVPMRKQFSTPDFKQAKSVDSKSAAGDHGFVGLNPYRNFNAYPNSKGYGSKIRTGK